MSEIITIRKGSYKFKAKQCGLCKKNKTLNKFRYIQYFEAYRKICIQCEKRKREKIKKEKIKFKKKHGVPLRVYRNAEVHALIKANRSAENFIFSKISNEAKKKFNFSDKIRNIVNGINFILFCTLIFFTFTLLNESLSELFCVTIICFSTVSLIILNKIKNFYLKKYWFPINKEILDQKELFYPNMFEQILTDAREEFQRDEHFYLSPEWKEVRKQILRSQHHICYICNEFISDPFDLTVDHIKPKSKYPELSLELSNLKIACRSCNSAKGNKDMKDFRKKILRNRAS